MLTTPFVLIGTHEQLTAQLQRQAQQWGITSYVVRETAVADLEAVLQHLNTRPT